MRRFAAVLAPAVVLALTLVADPITPNASAETMKTIVGPSQIYYADSDTVLILATKEWISAATRHQEKLLRTALRLRYWREHIPADMRAVFDELGYPTGRVLTTPIGHTEELWYYGPLSVPVRFRDGVLVNPSQVEALSARR